MADHQITPYRVMFTPKGDPASPRKLGNINVGAEQISATEAIMRTVVALSKEDHPRERADDNTRLLDIESVTKVGSTQIEIHCALGIKGFHSILDLEAAESRTTRKYNDAEWFPLRAMFAGLPTARAGILMVESVSNFGVAKHLADLLKSSIRANLGDQVMVQIEPIQDAAILGSALAELETKFLEFKTIIPSEEPADNVVHGGKELPFVKTLKIHRRGGLGKFGKFMSKNSEELAKLYGFLANDASLSSSSTEVSAMVQMRNGKPKKIKTVAGKLSAVTFDIERDDEYLPPNKEEFRRTAATVVEEVRTHVGLAELSIIDSDQEVHVESGVNLETEWVVPNVTPPAEPGEHR